MPGLRRFSSAISIVPRQRRSRRRITAREIPGSRNLASGQRGCLRLLLWSEGLGDLSKELVQARRWKSHSHYRKGLWERILNCDGDECPSLAWLLRPSQVEPDGCSSFGRRGWQDRAAYAKWYSAFNWRR